MNLFIPVLFRPIPIFSIFESLRRLPRIDGSQMQRAHAKALPPVSLTAFDADGLDLIRASFANGLRHRFLQMPPIAALAFLFGSLVPVNHAVADTPLTTPAATDGPAIQPSAPLANGLGTSNLQPDEAPRDLSLTSPSSRHIVQRDAANLGNIPLAGSYTGNPGRIEARAVVMDAARNSGQTTDWQMIANAPADGVFSGTLGKVPAGGWYQLEVRSVTGEIPGNAVVVEKIGVGDIYVTCGQSNSANHGQGGHAASDDRVCARSAVNGSTWSHAADPLPIASGGGGSVWTRLGDMLATAENIPIGFVAVGVGSTQVADWTPGTSNYNNLLKPAVQSFPHAGFRAVLWHQGESDAIANITAATHASRLNSLIAQSRIDAGWAIPWYVAEASFHPATTLSQEEPVTAGQRLVAHGDPLVFLGPTTDAYHLEDANGGKLVDTVHFNHAGLLDHAGQWRDILCGTTTLTPRNGGFEENRTPSITGHGPLADGESCITTITDTDSPMVIGWRILNASGNAAADGGNGYHNPSAGTYAAAVDTTNDGVLPHMTGRHVAKLDGGSAGNHFLHSTRAIAKPHMIHQLTVAIGVRENPAGFGTARLEITANGAVVASGVFNKAALDALHGGDASGTFTDASVSWTTGASVAPNQPLAIRIVKEGGGETVIDFDNVRFTCAASEPGQSITIDP
jgi:hypothetical protein